MSRRLELIAEMTPAIWVHLICVVAALILGAFVLWRRKGDARHRMLGRIWVGLMAVGALSSFAIREINPGGFSPIHLLSVYTLCSLVLGVLAVRARPARVRAHQNFMRSLYASGLLIAGAFTFLPQRLLGRLTFGEWIPAINYGVVAVMAGIGTIILVRVMRAER
ncbi:putative membrane protein [Litoreibacter ponti]|uniref:Putative membrane protein n=1 Tax=Litoreibacter ponti TaxID=1510457 RepID=A0A2T6BLQ2_9RHOB|nr:DUF2306 domain-containing protein [Litoreibacter ponti]PTX56982.1 putative membrane protein [Litoreibacter ponti]